MGEFRKRDQGGSITVWEEFVQVETRGRVFAREGRSQSRERVLRYRGRSKVSLGNGNYLVLLQYRECGGITGDEILRMGWNYFVVWF